MSIDTRTKVARTVFDHPCYGTRGEALALPLASPRVAEACTGRRVLPSTGTLPGEVWLLHGNVAHVHPSQLHIVLARIEGRSIAREGLADVIAWVGDAR